MPPALWQRKEKLKEKHTKNEEQAIRITRQDTHFPVASQARQSLSVGRKANQHDFKVSHSITTDKKGRGILLQMANINKDIAK